MTVVINIAKEDMNRGNSKVNQSGKRRPIRVVGIEMAPLVFITKAEAEGAEGMSLRGHGFEVAVPLFEAVAARVVIVAGFVDLEVCQGLGDRKNCGKSDEADVTLLEGEGFQRGCGAKFGEDIKIVRSSRPTAVLSI